MRNVQDFNYDTLESDDKVFSFDMKGAFGEGRQILFDPKDEIMNVFDSKK